MPTFVYMTKCDGCGHCVDICPSDIMHIDKTYRRAMNIEPNMCWECYSCVKACPQNAIDARGYADFAPMGHSVRGCERKKKAPFPGKLNSGMVRSRILCRRSPRSLGVKKFQSLLSWRNPLKKKSIHSFSGLSRMRLISSAAFRRSTKANSNRECITNGF